MPSPKVIPALKDPDIFRFVMKLRNNDFNRESADTDNMISGFSKLPGKIPLLKLRQNIMT